MSPTIERRRLAVSSGDILLEHLIARPDIRRYGSPLLLLHDAWHAAWCWEEALADFAGRGFEAHAISFRSHGASTGPKINDCSLGNYVDDLRAALGAIGPQTVVVGHGMGAFVAQAALARGTPIVAAVLLCPVPPIQGNAFVARWLRRHPLAAAKGMISANAAWLVNRPELAREAFFAPDIDEALLAGYLRLLGPESAKVLTFMSRELPPPPPTAHTLVVAAEHDALLTPEEQELTALRCRAEIVTIPGAPHDIMLSDAWPAAARSIERWVQDIALGAA